jgi:chemotaxis signal transduction protein
MDRPTLTRLPRLPVAVMGITHHRGRIVTVLDAVLLLGLERTGAPSADPRVLVLDRGSRQLGLWVDGVDEVEALRIGADLPAGPSTALRIAQHHGQAVLAVDADKLVELILQAAA